MNSFEASIILRNLLDRVVTYEDGRMEMTGRLTDSEMKALQYALFSISNNPSDINEEIPNPKEEKDSEPKPTIEIDCAVLSLDPPSDDIRLCFDFGTAMSKVTMVRDYPKDGSEEIHVLDLGIPGDQEQISENMLVSSVYVDNNGLLWFGQNAVSRSLSESVDGNRRRLDNIKRWLSEDGFDETVSKYFNPTGINISYGDMIQAYLMFLTWTVNHCVEELDFPLNTNRRFAMPVFEGAKKRETIHRLRKMLGDAQILADTFYSDLQNGIPLQAFVDAQKSLNNMNNKYSFVTDDITEPLGVAGSLLSWKKSINSLVLIIDIGAGTSDFSMFKISVDPDTGVSASVEVADSSRCITEAGNFLDSLLNGYILKKAGITHEHPLYLNITGALSLTIRDNKEALFNDDFVSVSLFNNETVEVEKDEFLDLPSVRQFENVLKETMQSILESIDNSWLSSAPVWSGLPTLTVALTGGGAELPMVKSLANGELEIKDNKIRLQESLRFPSWFEEEGYEDLEESYPRIAVALGGARRNVIPHGGSAAETAGDIKEAAILGGYYQKGN
jgi:hypothetical protein